MVFLHQQALPVSIFFKTFHCSTPCLTWTWTCMDRSFVPSLLGQPPLLFLKQDSRVQGRTHCFFCPTLGTPLAP